MSTASPSLFDALAKHLRGLTCVRESGAYGYVDGWSLWTDGWCLVAVQADIGLGEWHIENGDKPTADWTLKYLKKADAPADAVRVSLVELRAFALQGRRLYAPADCPCKGTYKPTTPCSECAGAKQTLCECNCGEMEHFRKCEECHGSGFEDGTCPGCGPLKPKPTLRGAILDRPFNLNLLAEGLRIPVVESVLAAIVPEDHDGFALRLWSDGFRFAQMGLREGIADDDPRFLSKATA